jgi:hypothetical protein
MDAGLEAGVGRAHAARREPLPERGHVRSRASKISSGLA